jgi:hydrogenase maturation factor
MSDRKARKERDAMISFLELECERPAGDWVLLHIDEAKKLLELLKEVPDGKAD